MNLPQREHPEAVAELNAAAERYEDRELGLGGSLLDAATAARQSLSEWPHAWPPFLSWDREPLVRSKGIAQFPYRIVYFVTDEEVVIVAYAHESRRPGYWVGRLDV